MRKTGDDYLDSKEFRELLASYEDAVSSGQPVFMDAEELSEIADYYQMTDRMEEADEAINLAMKLAPGSIAPLTYKIHEALYNGQPDEAERLLDMIIDRNEPDYVYDKGEIMLSRGKLDEAVAFFLQEWKDVPPEENDDYAIDVASIFHHYNFHQQTDFWLQKVSNRNITAYKELKADTLMALGHPQESQQLYNQLIDENPFNRRYWSALASAQFLTEDYAAALQSIEYAIAIDSEDSEALVIKGNILYKLDDYEESLKFYRRYSERVPDDELALLHQSNCLTALQRTDEALAILSEAEQVAPSDSPYLQDIYMEQAFIYCDRKDFNQAMACIEKTRQTDCDPIQLKLVEGHVLLASGRPRESARLFRQAVEASDDPFPTILRVIISTLENKYASAAYTLFKRFFLMVPEDYPEGHAYMALCCYELKRYDEFLQYLEKGCALNPAECKTVLSHIFPDDVEPTEYYHYVKEKMTL